MYLKKSYGKGIPYNSRVVIPRYRHISPTTVLIAATLFIFCSFSLFQRAISLTDDNKWDLLIFTQNWPISVCNHWVKEGHECRTFPNDTWTIHGIWPTKIGTIGPGFCNKSRPFNPEALYGIEDELEKYWAPVEKHKKKTALWSHEWEKHGTCAAVIPSLASEFQYFNQGLMWIKDYNIHSVLQKANITPGKQYNITEIWDGVQKVLGKNPQVVCYEEKGNITVLLEVRICFNQTLNLEDCDGTVVGHAGHSSYHNLTNCAIEKFVRYPDTLDFIPNQENTTGDVERGEDVVQLSSDDISSTLLNEPTSINAEELCNNGVEALAVSWSGVAETILKCMEFEDE